MKNLYLLAILIFPFHCLNAQVAPNIEWQKTYGGGGIDQAKSILQCNDGGYVVAGHSTSANGDVVGAQAGYNFWVLKLSNAGAIEWQKPLGGSAADWGTCIRQTQDGGFIFCGYTTSNNGNVSGNHGDFDYWVVKLTQNGDIEWQKTYGGLAIDQAKHIEQCTDGGYIVAGTSFSLDGNVSGNHGSNDFWLVKIDSVGILQWQKSLGGAGYEMANCVKQTTDGGYIVAGYSSSSNANVGNNYGESDYWVVKTDEFGAIEWEKNYGGSAEDQAFSIALTTDGGYIVAGYTYSVNFDITNNHGAADYWIVKLDNNGGLEWQKSFGGTSVDQAYAIQQTTDGDYVVAGFGTSNSGDITDNHGNNDYWILKLSPTGTARWKKSFGGSGIDQAYAIQQTADYGLIVTGFTTSSNGDLTDDNINGDYWVLKLETAVADVEEYDAIQASVFPNPSGDFITVNTNSSIKNIYVYNVYGQLVRKENKSTFSIEDLAAGIYTLQLETGVGAKSIRVIKR